MKFLIALSLLVSTPVVAQSNIEAARKDRKAVEVDRARIRWAMMLGIGIGQGNCLITTDVLESPSANPVIKADLSVRIANAELCKEYQEYQKPIQ